MKSGKFLFIAMIFIVSLLCISAVSAADDAASDVIADNNDETILEESIDDADIGDSESDELGEVVIGPPLMVGTFTTLNNDLNNSNDVINLNYDYEYIESDGNDFKDGVTINHNVTINGNGHEINAANQARIFKIPNDITVVLKNINFINGYSSGYGGAIYSYGIVTVINCNFTNNHAGYDGGAIEYGDVINCTFINNHADGYGGAIDSCNATNCVFINNSAKYGGAVWGGSGRSVVDCSFIGNNATEYGGAVDYAKAINCNFTNNTANSYAGAICNGDATGCIFTGNYADYGDGGAIYDGDATGCTFTGNFADSEGGAIYNGNAIGCNFNNNGVYGNGGAIYNGDATSCTFTDNYADYGDGGAICNGDAAGCTFISNYASDGGAIYNGNAVNCTFTNNSAEFTGGAIDTGNATNCIFSNNGAMTLEGVDGGGFKNGNADSCVFNGDSLIDVTIYQPTLSMGYYISTYDSPDKLAVNLTSHSGMQIDNANILVSVYTTAGAFVGNYTALSGGWKVPLNAGAYLVTYAAKDFDIDSVQNLIVIDKAKSAITSKAVTVVYNNNKYLVITLKDAYGKAISGAKVTVTLASAKTYKTDKNGQIKINVGKLVPKTYTAKISFAGNANILASSTTTKVVVKKATPKITAKAKTFKVKVKTKKYTITLKTNKGKVMKSTKVSLTVNKKTYTLKTNKKGIATFKITNLKKKGKYTAVIKYAGSKYYNKLTKKATITAK